jgi:hypothetical protein
MVKKETDLEKALGNSKTEQDTKKGDEKKQPKVPKEQEIPYHQGVLNTLASERSELFKMIQNIESIMQAHIKRLEELGVKIQKKQPKKK